jgi:hypothetical protein
MEILKEVLSRIKYLIEEEIRLNQSKKEEPNNNII